jgi:cytochrome b involved in lipid metabolism
MKKAVAISLFIFWMVATAIITAGLVFYQNNKTAPTPVTANNSLPGTTIGSSVNNNSQTTNVILNIAEVNKHSSINDCWMIISGKVYDLTSYIKSFHPGGAQTILPYCGQDGTNGFATKDGFAYNQLTNYLIGDLNQTITDQNLQTTVNNVNTNAASSANQSRSRGEYEDD